MTTVFVHQTPPPLLLLPVGLPVTSGPPGSCAIRGGVGTGSGPVAVHTPFPPESEGWPPFPEAPLVSFFPSSLVISAAALLTCEF